MKTVPKIEQQTGCGYLGLTVLNGGPEMAELESGWALRAFCSIERTRLPPSLESVLQGVVFSLGESAGTLNN